MGDKTRVKYRRKRPNVEKLTSEKLTLSPRESSAITGIGLTNTYRLLAAGRMPAIRINGGKYVIPKAALLKWLEGCGSTITAA